MASHKDGPVEEIIIVRRRRDEDDHHHGGAWKIAYADFVTALMSFFLVMWLINAANTETKASVASYFNPMKLTDTVVRRKGLLDVDERSIPYGQPKIESEVKGGKESGSAGHEKSTGKDKGDKARSSGKDAAADHAAERRQRLALAKELAKEDATAVAKPGESQAGAGAASEVTPTFRDPFNPLNSPRSTSLEESSRPVAEKAAPPPTAVPPAAAEAAKRAADVAAQKENAGREKLAADADNLLRETQAVVRRLGITSGPGIDVRVEDDGIVLSLTDTATFGMFAVGSADPNDLVFKLIQSLTPVLSANSDRIVLRGHTDSRPFRGDPRNNNWRLAMARAEAAYAMLLRSGIDELRFERIEAHADRKPKIATDTEAAANRRIEQLLRRSKR